jgi:hypothetical protein
VSIGEIIVLSILTLSLFASYNEVFKSVIVSFILECPPLLETSDVTILGNMWAIGSKAILRCQSGYIPLSGNKSTVATSCGNNGVWSEELTCEPGKLFDIMKLSTW